MKRKRLPREGWGFQRFPYYQMRIDNDDFHGLVGLIRLTSGHNCYWHMPRAGKVAVCGEGMTWLQLIPDGAHHVLTAKINPRGRVNVWYADVIGRVEYDEDGVAAFVDMYLDVIFSPKGDVHVDDRDELDAAHASGELTDAQYERALAEGESILREMCSDISWTEKRCRGILRHVRRRLGDEDVLRRNVP